MGGTMNTASQWRLEIAQKIAPYYAAFPHVDAVVVLGGVARGWADDWSDIDLVVYWHEAPTEAERRYVIDKLDAHCWHFTDTFATQPEPTLRYWWEDYYVAGDEHSGLKIDVGHHLSRDMDAVIESVTQRFDTHSLKHEMLYSIKRVQVFYGEPRVNAWKAAAGACSEALAQTMVERCLDLPPLWSAEASVQRGDWLEYTRTMAAVSENLLKALVYLNREYHPGPRRQARLLDELALKPADCDVRLNLILRDEPDVALPAASALYDEILALAQTHLPQASLDPAQFHYRRKQWAEGPRSLFANRD
jgi:predicted nucleotidyltransferase